MEKCPNDQEVSESLLVNIPAVTEIEPSRLRCGKIIEMFTEKQ